MLTYVALIVAMLSALMAWSAHRKNKELRERIAQTNSRVYSLRRQLEEAEEKAGYERMQLKFQLLKLQGELKVTPDMKINEILAIHPQAEQVLAAFHLGGCSSCAVDPRQSLSEAVALNGRELEPILVALNNLVAAGDAENGPIPPKRLKTPNIQLML